MAATDLAETIAAIATPPGVGGIGIIRISGPLARRIGETLTGQPLTEKRVLFRSFYDVGQVLLDQGICFYAVAPHSFSGEDVVEVQGHGGPVLLDMLLERICVLGARLARAGEFSERAFLNGKMDLTQAEAVADLIESGSRAAAKAALRSLQGEFSRQIRALVEAITDLRVMVEAGLDFAEEDVDILEVEQVPSRLQFCRQTLAQILQQAQQGRILKDGLTLVLAGQPNVGKSSLMNYLAGYEAAIVTAIPGTTRDVLREHLMLDGIPVHMQDTAGLRDSADPVEQEGNQRAWQAIQQADRVLLLVDASQGVGVKDVQIMARLESYTLVYTKADLLAETTVREPGVCYVSSVSGEGMADLTRVITGQNTGNHENQTLLARRRHIDALQRAGAGLERADQALSQAAAGELMAEDLRNAQQCLNEITGEFTTEDLLGRIFSRFCIGK